MVAAIPAGGAGGGPLFLPQAASQPVMQQLMQQAQQARQRIAYVRKIKPVIYIYGCIAYDRF